MLTPLLQYCTNDIKEDLKPSTPALVHIFCHSFIDLFVFINCLIKLEAVAKFTMQIVSFIAQLPLYVSF